MYLGMGLVYCIFCKYIVYLASSMLCVDVSGHWGNGSAGVPGHRQQELEEDALSFHILAFLKSN